MHSFLKGYNIYRSDSLTGPYIKQNPLPIENFSGYTDDSLPELSTYYYKVCAVSIYGVEGPYTAPLKAWTSLPFHTGFPVTEINVDFLGHKSEGSPMTYDIDNNGDKEIFVNLSDLEGNKGALLGFFQNGEEVFDIDSNSNTVSGFYKYNNAGSRSIPAIANIDMDGKPEIINVTKGDPIIDDKRTLFVHHTFDHDNNYVPDTLWSAESGNFQTMGAVVSDLDGDFVPEIITKANYGAPIYVYSHEGSNYPGWPKNIGSAGGNVIPVATDLDRDGNKELVFGFSNGDGFDGGIYVFKNNGDPFFSEAANGLFYKSGMSGSVYDRMDSPVTAADVNGDGYPELICVSGNKDSLNNLKANIFILDKLGNTITGWDYNNPNHRLSIQSQELAELPATSVADIDHDFHFEIFLAANNKIYAWKPDGTPLNNHFPINVPGLLCKLIAPLIADVDGDDESEIIVLSNANENNSAIHAYNLDGSMVLGWPLRIPGENFFATPCIDDIDQDGKNEIIATAGSKIYVWDCEGSTDEILWGKYRLNSYNNADLSDPCEYSTTPFYVSSEMTWTNDVQMNSDLIIQPGAKLTIKGNLYMPSEGKIIVKQSPSPAKMAGGTLVIDGGTITTLCRDSLWKGIEVWGLPGYSQTAHIANGKLIQGQVSIIHNGSIHNAKTGILASKEGIHGYAGGIVSADSATFENNRVAIRYDPYSYYNFSRLKRCNFITSDTLRDGSTPDYFVKLNGVNPVVFEGCTFKNTLPPPTIVITNTGRGSGIFSENAGFNVVAACLDSTSPCSHSRNSSFEKLYRGIYSMNSASAGSIHIADVNFYDNYAGLYLSGFNGVSYVEVLSNTFRNSSHDQWSYGMYLNECSGYHVENNEFYETSTNPVTIGLIVNNSGTLSNEIYRNSFHNLKYATLSQNVNRNANPDIGGLCYKCNKFVKDDLTEPNQLDITITYDGQAGITKGIAYHQGLFIDQRNYAAIGNMFAPYPSPNHYDFYNEGTFIQYYFTDENFNQSAFRTEPWPNNLFKYGLLGKAARTTYFYPNEYCPSMLNNGGSQENLEKLEEAILKSKLLYNELSSLVDGGSTPSLNLEVATSIPANALQTRDELLNESPYLSDTVMTTSIMKEDVLDNVMIRDVLVANPQSAKSDLIISKIENRIIPMPDYMMEQILAGEDILGSKEILEGEKAYWEGEKEKAYTRLLQHYRGDSIVFPDTDSLTWLFTIKNSLDSYYDWATYHHTNRHFNQQDSLINLIPSIFSLTPSQQSTHQAFIDLFEITEQLLLDTLNILETDSQKVFALQNVMSENNGLPAAYARNILIYAGKITYQEPIILPDTNLKSTKRERYRGVKLPLDGNILKIYPNPAKDYFIVEYHLESTPKFGSILIFNVYGKQVGSFSFTGKQNRIIIPTLFLHSGIYLLAFEVDGKRLETAKISIIE